MLCLQMILPAPKHFPHCPSTWHTAVNQYIFAEQTNEYELPIMIPFQPEILTKFLDVGKNSFKIPAEPMILILNNLSKKKKKKSLLLPALSLEH